MEADEPIIFKCFLRELQENLKTIKRAIEDGDTGNAERLLDDLIGRTQSGLESG